MLEKWRNVHQKLGHVKTAFLLSSQNKQQNIDGQILTGDNLYLYKCIFDLICSAVL